MLRNAMTKKSPPALVRPRNSSRTKALILEAAQRAFSANGYRDVGIRDIAAAAAVNQNLITRYYGGKANLFKEALADMLHLDEMFDTEREKFGANLTSLLRRNDTRTMGSGAMMALSVGDPQARHITGEQLKSNIMESIAEWLGGPNAKAKANVIAILSLGFTVMQLLTADEKENPQELQFVDDWLASVLQHMADTP